MSSQMLTECMMQFKRLGFSPEFRSYFLRQKSHLLASGEVACGLVAYCVQDDGASSETQQILSLLLDEARMGLENDNGYAEDFLETVEMAVQAGVAAGAIQQSNLIEFASLYRGVGLPVPQGFLIDPDNMDTPEGSEDFDLSENLESMAQAIEAEGGTAYDLFNNVDTMMAAAPEEFQAGFVNHIATMDGAFFERCSLFMLLSGSELVQEAAIAGLFERLDASALTAETLTLLPMIRGWFPKGTTQTALDELFKKARRKAIPGQSPHDSVAIQEAIASITDGVGAQSIAVKLKRGSTTLLAMLLLKTGFGIKDAFLVPPENNSDPTHIINQLRAETGADNISVNTLRVLLEGALADGLEHGHLPAPGFLDVIEGGNLFDLRPQELDLQTLLNLADPDRKIQDASAQALGRWINDDIALDNLEHLTDSWFEDNEATREIVATARTARSIETKLWKFLDSRREVWARRFLQTAVMLRDGHRPREWQTMTASAYGLMNGRALKRVPLIEDIMHTTIEAADAKMW